MLNAGRRAGSKSTEVVTGSLFHLRNLKFKIRFEVFCKEMGRRIVH